METPNNKCYLKEHSDINASIYCKECEKYMCDKCEIEHSESFDNHKNIIFLSENIEESSNEYCQEEKHHNFQLNYFCKTHNK